MNLESKKIDWLLADDHSIVRQGIAMLIESLFPESHCKHCTSLQEIQECLENQVPDIAIFDAQFQDGNIMQILRDIRNHHPTLKILIFSSFDEEKYALRFLEAGANGFLPKLSSEEDLELAIQKIATEGSYLSDSTQKLLVNSIHNNQPLNPLSTLTERELQIAEMYAQGLGNLEISNALEIKQNTVSTIKKRILEKLNLQTTLELVDLLRSERFQDL